VRRLAGPELIALLTAARIDIGGELDTAVSLSFENGRITRIYAIRNPHKLARLDGVAALTRT
jgi:RNA polymerase sigma-70 factor (ECF subfamily)